MSSVQGKSSAELRDLSRAVGVGAVQQQRWQQCSRKEELLAPCYYRRGRCRQ